MEPKEDLVKIVPSLNHLEVRHRSLLSSSNGDRRKAVISPNILTAWSFRTEASWAEYRSFSLCLIPTKFNIDKPRAIAANRGRVDRAVKTIHFFESNFIDLTFDGACQESSGQVIEQVEDVFSNGHACMSETEPASLLDFSKRRKRCNESVGLGGTDHDCTS